MLIVVEGLDGSGKSTQVPLILPELRRRGIEGIKISFPDYDSESSALIKMYLSGALGADAAEINAYAASSFYAVDRYASFHTKWKREYEEGALIITERYTSSNLIYQMCKLPKEQWDAYIAWADDFEHVKLKLPRPDLVIYLSMPLDISQSLLTRRYEENKGKRDIHESNLKFLRDCSETAAYTAGKLHWHVIECAEDGKARGIEEIHEEIIDTIIKKLERR